MIQNRKNVYQFVLGLVGLSLVSATVLTAQISFADDAKKDGDPKPAVPDTKTGDGGVSINLKVVPPTPPEVKPTEPKKDAAPSTTAAEKQSKEVEAKKKAEMTKPADAAKTTNDKSAGKPAPTGSVELKLLPPKPPASTEKSTDKPTGTVEMSVVSAKEKPAETGTVTIDLTPPKIPTAAQDTNQTENAEKQTKVTDLKKPPRVSKLSDLPPSDQEESVPKQEKKRGSKDGDPGDPGDGEVEPLPPQPGDLPLVQEAHPFDAPAAAATKQELRITNSKKIGDLSEADKERNQRITAVLEYYRTHHENVVRRGPWALMHTILPYGVDTEIIAGKQKVNAIGWLCHNGISAKQRMFQPTQTGFRTNVGPGVQGHEGQFLAILAQSHVNRDYQIQIGNRKYTINDLIKYEMATCREKTELTFKLIAFTHYLEPNQTWKDNRGRSWSIEKLVAEELAQPINGEACGGTHRLMGLTCAVVSRQEARVPITGQFERAEKFLNDFIEYTLTLQNSDGSFSTEWFERRADEPNVERKVQTTGHITEWLIYTLPDEHLRSPEIEKAVDFLLNTIGKNPSKDWPIGPRGHSLRALDLYQKRVYNGKDISTETNLARPQSKSIQR